MKFTQNLIALAACFLPLIAGIPTAQPHMKIQNPGAKNVIPNSYIVVFNKDIDSAAIKSEYASVNSMLSKRGSAHKGIGSKYDLEHFKGYQIEADTATIDQIASSPQVAWIEKDAKVHANALTTRSGAPWGLNSISHKVSNGTTRGIFYRQTNSTSDYTYDDSAGSGATVYIVDTGIFIEHKEFEGRATWGKNFIEGSKDTDENGHGTHCAGTIGGATYGVSNKAKLVAVKVLDGEGSGSNSGVIAGIEWVGKNAGPKSVLSMSLGGELSEALNAAAASTIKAGVTVVVAAGNDGADASGYSPASAPDAITVGAIDKTNTRADFSNFGPVLDVFAPGVDVLSAWIGSPDAQNTISGTSMATPHVAGLAAYLIGLENLATPAAVVARIQDLASKGAIPNPENSKNYLAYNGNGA
ncbi:hypothetical protein V495_00278 [Pseudogymnoascus sp. VKM F-4514 (FW-929)]|nr:hypothetical protein V490_04708 [Pseudogymnoascus sp. VKM F-3557]KFY50394.1 hypothetical protein V495_00278 [Pseudogymnoascus sp. VKM F-4514 (FW-929)]KFY67769.1 hypothetical protein V497_00233 [Pseudogymnoascus sp. VKM F-4516 (FW-969)]